MQNMLDLSTRPIDMGEHEGEVGPVRDVYRVWKKVGHVQDQHSVRWNMAWKSPNGIRVSRHTMTTLSYEFDKSVGRVLEAAAGCIPRHLIV
jgi:hypothetical protein